MTRTLLTSSCSTPYRCETAQVSQSQRPPARAHTRAQASPSGARSEKRSHERRRAIWRGRRPRSGSALGSGGGRRGRRRWPRSPFRSRRSRRSVGTGTSEASGGAAAAVSSRRGAPGAAARLASAPRTAPAARAAGPGPPGWPKPRGTRPSRGCRRTKAPGEDAAPSVRGIGRAQDGRGFPLGMHRGPRVCAAQSQGAARSP